MVLYPAPLCSTIYVFPFYTQSIFPMNLKPFGLFVVIICTLQACNIVDSNELTEEEAIAAFFDQNPTAPREGDRVETNARAPIYNPLTVQAGTQPAGALGVVTNGPKLKSGEAWYRVDFDSGVDGLINANYLLSDDGDDNITPTNFTIGWIGCSMTRDLGKGVAANVTHESWELKGRSGGKVLQSYSGGVVSSWGTPGGSGYSLKWSAFDRGLENWPDTDLIIWQMCTGERDITPSPESRMDELEHISTRVAEKAPGIPLYIINQPTYEGIVCSITGRDGVAYSQSLVDLAIQRGLAQEAAGLTLGPLNANDVKDGCHVNRPGQAKIVAQLLTWLESR